MTTGDKKVLTREELDKLVERKSGWDDVVRIKQHDAALRALLKEALSGWYHESHSLKDRDRIREIRKEAGI